MSLEAGERGNRCEKAGIGELSPAQTGHCYSFIQCRRGGGRLSLRESQKPKAVLLSCFLFLEAFTQPHAKVIQVLSTENKGTIPPPHKTQSACMLKSK